VAKRSKQEIRRTAWHEAGHVVHALAVGIPFTAASVRHDTDERIPDDSPVAMAKSDESNGAMLAFKHTYTGYPEDYIANCMAGIAGERILHRATKPGKMEYRDVTNGSANDIVKATKAVRMRNADPRAKTQWDEDKALNDGLAEAFKVLKRHAKALKLIAEHLEKGGYIGFPNALMIFVKNKGAKHG
jgi:hypothetical protein